MLLLSVFLFGTLGYIYIENYNIIDAVYMTTITVASVGFGEVQPLDDAGKVFTTTLIVLSVISYAYAITVVTSIIIEGEFNIYFKHYRVNKEIKKLQNHVIVCGYGRNGRQACEQLSSGNLPFLVVEQSPMVIEQLREEGKILFIEGNSTHDEVLMQAGIENAKALITTLPDDADNVFVVLTARGVNPNMKIISRASNDGAESKLKRAGANNVIMPDKIGGTHMAALITKPDVLEFLDYITGKINIRIEEIHFDKLPSRLKNKNIHDLEIRKKTGANVIGFKKGTGEYTINPSPETIMEPDTKIFVLGTEEQVNNLYAIFKEG
jgi:voltage-gated potassium channel